MSLFKGRMDSGGLFTAQDDVRGLRIIAPGALPSYWSVECGDGVDWYFWVNDSDELIMDNSAPTSTYDSVGNIVTGAGNSGANVTLSNLGTTTCNESLISDTDATDDLGTAAAQWANAYVNTVYLTDTSILAGGTDVCTFTGGITLGTDGTGYDVIFYGDTATSYLMWDQNAYTNVGALLFKNNVRLAFGAASATTGDVQIYGDGTNLAIEGAIDDVVIKSGAATDLDWQWESKTIAGQDMGWIADIGTLQLCGSTKLNFGGATVLTADDGFAIFFDDDATLNIDPTTADDTVRFGETTLCDVYFDGAAYDIMWDNSENELLMNDNTKLVFGGASDDLIITSNGTLVNMTFGATTNSLVLAAYAAQTVAALRIDGSTATWNGNDNIGMLHLDSDAALANAGASLLQVVHATTAPAASSQGFLARFVDTAAVCGTPPAYCVEIDSTNNFGLNIVTGKATSSNLVMSGLQAQTAAMLSLVGTTGTGFDGADAIGVLTVTHDGALAHVGASALVIDLGTGTALDASKGYGLRIDDEGTVATSNNAYVAVIDSLANHGLEIITQAEGD